MQPRSNLLRRTFPNLPYLSGNLLCRTAPKPSCRTVLKFPCRIRSPYFPFFSFPVRTLIFIPSLTPASFWSVPFFPVLLLFSSFTLIPAFALVSDFSPIPPRFFRLYFCFCPSSLYPHSLLFPIFPQSRPASSGFTPVFVLHLYARIRSYFQFFPNPVPLLSALLLLPSFIIPAFALIDIFTPYSFFFMF